MEYLEEQQFGIGVADDALGWNKVLLPLSTASNTFAHVCSTP